MASYHVHPASGHQSPRHRHVCQLAALVLLSALAMPALAIYQCEQQGKTVYQDTPCPGGKEISAPPAVSQADQQAAHARAAHDKAMAQELDAKRKQADAAASKNAAGHARHARQCQLLAQRQQWAEEDAASASQAKQAKARRKARRAQEKYQLECGPR